MAVRPPLRALIIGLGKAGGSLAASFAAVNVLVIKKARRLPRSLPDADVLFLAVPDDAIADVDAHVAALPALPPLVVHLSGARGHEALPLTARRTGVGTFHPLASLDGRQPIPHGTLIAVDALTTAQRALLTRVARDCGLVPARVPSSERARYHAGAVVSANLAVALLQRGVELLVDAGVPAPLARVSLARLLRSQADNAIAHPLADALTGPVARGDASTVKRHVQVLADAPALLSLYRALSLVLIDDVSKLSPAKKRALRLALKA